MTVALLDVPIQKKKSLIFSEDPFNQNFFLSACVTAIASLLIDVIVLAFIMFAYPHNDYWKNIN